MSVGFDELDRKHTAEFQKIDQELLAAGNLSVQQMALIQDLKKKRTPLSDEVKAAYLELGGASDDERAAKKAKDKAAADAAKKKIATADKRMKAAVKAIDGHDKQIVAAEAQLKKLEAKEKVVKAKRDQYAKQLATFRAENQIRIQGASQMPEKKMARVEDSYFHLLDELDLGLGDTVKKLNKLIDAKTKQRNDLNNQIAALQNQAFSVEGRQLTPKEDKWKDKTYLLTGKLKNEVEILTNRRDEYSKEKAALKQARNSRDISKAEYAERKKQLQAIVKFSQGI